MTDVNEITENHSNIPSMAKLPTTFGEFVIRFFMKNLQF